jgi:hypothetical protein
MSEDSIGGAPEDEDPNDAIEQPSEALISAWAFAAAVLSVSSCIDPQVARETSTFLAKQSRLIDIQAKHLEDEHELRLTQLHALRREGRIRRAGMRMRVAFQIFTAVVATFVVGSVVFLSYDAATSKRVVVEPFRVAPSLAPRGLSGTVVASGLKDELTRLQDATRSSAAAKDLSSAWAKDIKIEVPETGVSIGDISSMLSARFGDDQHIDGDLVNTPMAGLGPVNTT